MKFKEFYNDCIFELLAVGSANWDYYTMTYKDNPAQVVALAKPGTGANDCHFGNMAHFEKIKRKGWL